MLKSRLLAGVTAVLFLCSLRCNAETEAIAISQPAEDETNDEVVIEGDKLELHLDRTMRSIGNASIHRGSQDVYGDLIEYDVQNDELHVSGNVRIEVGDAKLTGPDLRMRLSESIGEMLDASITVTKPAVMNPQQIQAISADQFPKQLSNLQSQQQEDDNVLYDPSTNDYAKDAMAFSTTPTSRSARGDAEAIFFEGQDKKRLKKARYTTCEAGVDDWYIKANEINLNDFTESGTAKNAYIEFKGVPLLYTPWIGFSYNNQRKSGLLAPTVGSTSRSGFEVLTPFYWNISPNMDATLATRALSRRGVQLQGEFRYLEEKFSGIDSLEYLPSDRLTGETRYYANLKHQHTLGAGWSAGYSVEKVSDDQYFSDLSTRITTTSRINLPQQFNVNYSNDDWAFSGVAQKFQTLDDLSYPYERLPELTLKGDKYYGDFNTKLYSQFVAFEINNSAPTVPTGMRTTLYPSISLPINRPYGYVEPKIGIHHTNYSLDNVANGLESQQRTLPIFSVDSGLYFDRDFKVMTRNYSQTLEPRLFYLYIPEKDQSNIPVFDTSLTDLNFTSLFSENEFAGNDRINNANQVSFALTTRMVDSDTGIQRLSASVGQRYYFEDQKVFLPGTNLRKNNSSDLIAGLSANLRNSWDVDAFWQYNTDDSSGIRTTLTSRYNPEPGKTLNLSYSYRKDVANAVTSSSLTTNTGINQVDISAQWPLGKGWYGVGRLNYSFRENQLIESLAGLEYDAGCWQARGVVQRVETATADANYAFFFQLELGGLASIGANPLSVIRRNVPGYVSSGLIPQTYQQPY